MKIYLAGYISEKVLDQCTKWREIVKQSNTNLPIDWLDPLSGHQETTITNSGLSSNIPPGGIFYRDLQAVLSADLVIANLDTFGQSRPLTGTIFEMAWCRLGNIPLIVITDDPNYKYHPFILFSAAIIAQSVEELIKKEYIAYFCSHEVNNEISPECFCTADNFAERYQEKMRKHG